MPIRAIQADGTYHTERDNTGSKARKRRKRQERARQRANGNPLPKGTITRGAGNRWTPRAARLLARNHVGPVLGGSKATKDMGNPCQGSCDRSTDPVGERLNAKTGKVVNDSRKNGVLSKPFMSGRTTIED